MTDDPREHLIRINSDRLSDGSEVFSVLLPGGTKLPAITEADAHDLAEAIADAINDHTNETATVRDAYV